MKRILNGIVTVGVAAVAFLALDRVVARPAMENMWIKQTSQGNWSFRENASVLARADSFDPYLRGWALLQRARLLRSVGRSDEAVAAYRDALENRVPPDVRFEMGLYLMEIDRSEEGKREIVEAVRYSVGYLEQLPSSGLRNEIASRVKSEEARGQR